MELEKKTGERSRSLKLARLIWGSLPYLCLGAAILVIIGLAVQAKKEKARIEEAQAAGLKRNRPPVNVVALELVPTPIRDKISLPAVVEPWVELKVVTEVPGKVVKKNLDEGDTVAKGDIIAVLDSRDYKHLLRSAKASYQAAQATLKRMEKLQKGQLSTRSQLDDALAQSEISKAAMDTAALNLERCTIRAPISGVVNRMDIEEGEYLEASAAVAEILKMDRVKIAVGIPESDVDAVRNLTDFSVRIDALNRKVFSARKHFLSRTADEQARLYNLSLELDNPAGEILPDMFARVEIVKKEVPESLSVPLYAVISRNNENFVYVARDGRAETRLVALGLQEGWRTEITKGLEAGNRVIVVGHRGVVENQSINVVRTVTDPRDIIQ